MGKNLLILSEFIKRVGNELESNNYFMLKLF